MALNGLFCADVPLRNYSLTHSRFYHSLVNKDFQFCHNKLRLHTMKTRSLSHPVLIRYRVVTDGQTDGQTDRQADRQTELRQLIRALCIVGRL